MARSELWTLRDLSCEAKEAMRKLKPDYFGLDASTRPGFVGMGRVRQLDRRRPGAQKPFMKRAALLLAALVAVPASAYHAVAPEDVRATVIEAGLYAKDIAMIAARYSGAPTTGLAPDEEIDCAALSGGLPIMKENVDRVNTWLNVQKYLGATTTDLPADTLQIMMQTYEEMANVHRFLGCNQELR